MPPPNPITAEPTTPANNRATIISMAILAIAASSLLHEGLGHGLTAYLRGDIPTALTSNHLDDLRPDRLVDAAGTLVNLFAGALAMLPPPPAARRPNLRYFLWLLGCFNLMDGAGYFLFSGIIGVGDWQAVIAGLPHYVALRIAMTHLRRRALLPRRNPHDAPAPSLLPHLRLRTAPTTTPSADSPTTPPAPSTASPVPSIPSASSSCSSPPSPQPLAATPASCGPKLRSFPDTALHHPTTPLTVTRQPAWWIAAILIGLAYILILGRGIIFHH